MTDVIRAEDTPFVLRAANSAGATMLEYLRDLAARRGDRAHHDQAARLADQLMTATNDAADFIEQQQNENAETDPA